jgi:hypothetical protein
VAAHQAEELEAVQAREHDVEQKEVVRAREGKGETPTTVVCDVDPDTVFVEGVLKQLAQLAVIVDQEG